MKKMILTLLSLSCWVILSAQSFSEVAGSSGITTTYGDGNHGGGVSFADFNGDGHDDLTFTSANGLPVYFYQNTGNGSFFSLSLITNTQESKEAIWADYDNDGDQDLFLTVHNGANRLYRNDGNMNMVDVTMSAFGYLDNLQTFGAAWGDYDNDGWLDLYVCEYIISGTESNKLFRNNGDGTFADISAGTQCNDGPRLTFDACFFDRELDGWQDLYVINDKFNHSNALYSNQLGTYNYVPGSGANISIEAMNAGGGDFDNDGDYDLYVSNTQPGNQLLQNDGLGGFSNVAGATGTGVYQITWGSNFFDYDNDLDQDLYVSSLNNNVVTWYNAFLENEGDGTFSNNLAASGGLGGTDDGQSYGNAIGDFNNDGRLDIAVSQETDNNLLWRNDESGTGNYLRVRLTGTTSNSDGIGARVVMTVGPHQLTRFRQGSQGYLSQSSQSLHFGLGNYSQVDNITVYWPSGIVDNYSNVTAINQLMGLTEGETVLPLRLTDFSAEKAGRNNQLIWTTEQEVNTSHFSVEKSHNGRQFTEQGRVAASGESATTHTYGFLDESVEGLSFYYRLKMVDRDGSFTYSPLQLVNRTIRNDRKISALLANPTSQDKISVRLLPTVPAGSYALRLADDRGRLMRKAIIEVDGGLPVTHTFAPGLPGGTYLLSVSGMGITESHRLIIH